MSQVEATKFTEVGYHGRDVDQIIRDLVETSIALVKKRCKKAAAKIVSCTPPTPLADWEPQQQGSSSWRAVCSAPVVGLGGQW